MPTRLCLAFICVMLALPLTVDQAEARTTYRGSSAKSSSPSLALSRSCLKPSARALLNRIESQFGTVQIVSTCRPGARIRKTGKRSKHASGEAIDFMAPRGKKADIVRWLIANHRTGGTMTYFGMNHIHVDVGYRFVSLGARA